MKQIFLLLVLSCLLFSGCSAAQPESLEAEGIVFTDSLGRSVSISNPQRVGIASGSLAECWMLAGGTVHGVTRDAVTERKLDLPSTCVDLGSLKEPSLEAILAADLDLLLLMSALPNHVEMSETLDKAGVPYAYFDIENFEDYLDVMELFTTLTGQPQQYETYGTALQPVIQSAIQTGFRADAPKVLALRTSSSRIKVLTREDMLGEMLTEFGCVNISDDSQTLLTDLSMEAIASEDPEYIFISCMGDLAEGKAQLETSLISNPVWNTLQAVKQNHVYYLEKELFHYKPNARWGESYVVLSEILAKR